MKYSLVALQSQTAFFILPQQRRDSNWMEQWTLDNNWEIEKWIKVNMDNDWIEIKIHTFLIANHLIHFCVVTWYDFHVMWEISDEVKIKKLNFIQKRWILASGVELVVILRCVWHLWDFLFKSYEKKKQSCLEKIIVKKNTQHVDQ